MGTKQFNNYEDLLTFTRASGGHALRPVSYGDELVTNGTFDSDIDDWVNGAASFTTLSYDAGTLEIVASGGNARANQGPISVETGKLYLLSAEVTQKASDGDSFVHLGTTLGGADIQSNITQGDPVGVSTYAFVATSNDLYIQLGATAGDTVNYDNISVKEVTFDESDGTLTLFEHPDDVPRVEWDSAGNRLGLLVEEARTNLVTYSEDLADSSWNKGGSTTVTTNFTESPDKQKNGVRIQMTASVGTYASRSFSATSGTEYTISLWAKNNGGDSFNFGYASTVSSGVTDGSTVTATGEWVRYSHTFTAPSTGTYYIAIDNVSNTSAVDVLVFGVQLETGSFPTSYIKSNSGSTTTRSADIASIPVADFGDNIYEGTIVYEGQDIANNYSGAINSGGGFHVWFGYNGNNYVAGCYHSNTSGLTGQGYFRGDGTLETANSATLMSGQSKAGFSYELGKSVAICVDGQSVVEATATVPTAYENTDWKFVIGAASSGAITNTSSIIKSLKYYPRRLTNAQLQDLTS